MFKEVKANLNRTLSEATASCPECAEYMDDLSGLFVERKGDNDETLMGTTHIHGILKKGEKFNLVKFNHGCPSMINDLQPDTSAENLRNTTRVLHCSWKSDLKVATAKEANVFGKSGTLIPRITSEQLSLPKMDARKVHPKILEKFKVELKPVDIETTLPAGGEYDSLALVEYYFAKSYAQKYVFNSEKGGGLFVEKHPFPHVFMPMSPSCSGAIIIGRKILGDIYEFISLEVPYGFSLHVQSNVIHGDSFFIGPYSIALTEKIEADTVIFREYGSAFNDKENESSICKIQQHAVCPQLTCQYELKKSAISSAKKEKVKLESERTGLRV